MGILSAIKAFFSAVAKIAEALNNRQLINAGKSAARLEDREIEDTKASDAVAARDDVDRVRDLAKVRFRD